jgi:O-antigen/teichoic acid export membrane protein
LFNIDSIWAYYLLFLVVFETITTLYLNICISKENAGSVSSIRIIKTAVEFSLSILLVVILPLSLTGRMGAIFVGATVAAIWSGYKLSKNFQKSGWGSLFKNYKRVLTFSIPLIPHQISHWLKQGLDRLLVTFYFGLSINAVYVVSFQLVSVVLIIAVAINNAYSPYLFKLLAKKSHPEKDKNILHIVYLFIVFITIVCVVLYFTLPYIFKLVLSEKYSAGVAIAQFLLIGIYFKALYYSVVGFIIFHEKTKILTVITFSSSLLYISLFYVLKSTFGLNALPASLAVAELLSLFAVLFYSNKLNPLPWFKSILYVSK